MGVFLSFAKYIILIIPIFNYCIIIFFGGKLIFYSYNEIDYPVSIKVAFLCGGIVLLLYSIILFLFQKIVSKRTFIAAFMYASIVNFIITIVFGSIQRLNGIYAFHSDFLFNCAIKLSDYIGRKHELLCKIADAMRAIDGEQLVQAKVNITFYTSLIACIGVTLFVKIYLIVKTNT